MIYLSERDILHAVTVAEVLDTVEEAMLLYETKDFLMPQRMHIDHGDNVLFLMLTAQRARHSSTGSQLSYRT